MKKIITFTIISLAIFTHGAYGFQCPAIKDIQSVKLTKLQEVKTSKNAKGQTRRLYGLGGVTKIANEDWAVNIAAFNEYEVEYTDVVDQGKRLLAKIHEGQILYHDSKAKAQPYCLYKSIVDSETHNFKVITAVSNASLPIKN